MHSIPVKIKKILSDDDNIPEQGGLTEGTDIPFK